MRRSLLIFLVIASCAAGSTARAQDTPPDSSRREAKPDRAAGPQGANSTPPREEHVIYVPYNKLPEVFEKEGASVLLPYAQFLQLWNGFHAPLVPLPVKPPIMGLISRADYSGRIENGLARLKLDLTVDVLGDEWVRLPLQFGDAAVGKVEQGGEHVLLRGVGDGGYELLARGRGKHDISIELVVRVQTSADGKSFSVRCPAVGVSNLRLEFDQPDLSVQVNPRRTAQIERDEKRTVVQAALGSTDQFSVAWQPRSGAAAEMAGLASVSDTFTVEVGDGIVHTHAVFDYQILRGSLEALAIRLPADQRLLDVQAPGLRDWQSEAVEEGNQLVTVRLHAAARDKVRVELRTESPIPQGDFAVGRFQAVGAARESGVLVLRSTEDVALEVAAHSGVSRIDASEVPEPLRKPRSTFYKFFSPDFQIVVAASTLEPRVSAESLLTVAIDRGRVTTRGEFKLDVTRAGIFSIAIRLPDSFQVDEVSCESMDRHEVSRDERGQVLTVFLTKKVLGALKLSLAASRAQTVRTGAFEIPLLEPMAVAREQGLVAVIAPESIELNTDPSKLQSARSATPAELVARGFQPQPPHGSTVAAAFAFAQRPVRIELAAQERPRRVLATVATAATVKEDVVSVHTRIDYDVQYAATDTFRFAVPAGVADQVQIEGDGIKEKQRSAGPLEDGSVAWTVVLHAEAIGSRTFHVKYDHPIALGDASVSQAIQPVRVLDVDRESGEMAIFKDRALAITATHQGLEEIDVRELAQPVAGATPSTLPYLSYRYFRHPAQLTLAITKHEIEGVVKTVVSRAFIDSVVSRDGPLSVRAQYWIKSSERQRLAVTLPATRLLSVTVAGRSMLPEKAPAPPGAEPDDKSYFINIDRPTGPDEPFALTLVYEAPPPGGDDKLGYTGALDIRLPQFEQGVKFQLLYFRLWLPDGYEAVGEASGFTSEGRPRVPLVGATPAYPAENPESWFPADPSKFDFRTAGRSSLYSSLNPPPRFTVQYWRHAPMTVAGSLVVLAAGLLLSFLRVETKVLAVFAAAVALLFAALFWPETVHDWLMAARIGLVAAAVLWFVVFLLRVRHAVPIRAVAAAGAGTVLLSTAGAAATTPEQPPTPPAHQSQPAEPEPPDNPTTGEQKGGGDEAH